jgi:hypothetical protein
MHSTFQKLMAAGLLGFVCLLGGCITEPTHYDNKFGDAVNAAKAQQIINIDAADKKKREPGMDGPAAKSTITRYHKSFESPPPPSNVFNIGIGSSSGSGTGSGTQ